MKKIMAAALLLVFCLMSSGCANRKMIDGVEYDTYGLLNKDEKKNPNIHYELVWGNVILGAILCKTIIAPVYFYGFSIWEPVDKNTGIPGQVQK